MNKIIYHTLKRRKDFVAIRYKGKFAVSKNIILQYYPNETIKNKQNKEILNINKEILNVKDEINQKISNLQEICDSQIIARDEEVAKDQKIGKGTFFVGFTATKKIGNAVVRNRVKRRMREALRTATVKVKRNSKMVFIARKNIINSSFLLIKKDMTYLLKKAKLI